MTKAEVKGAGIKAAKLFRVFELIKLLCNGEYRLEALSEILEMDERTVRRYIKFLEYMGMQVDQDFEGRYFIVEGCCPLCGTTNNHNE